MSPFSNEYVSSRSSKNKSKSNKKELKEIERTKDKIESIPSSFYKDKNDKVDLNHDSIQKHESLKILYPTIFGLKPKSIENKIKLENLYEKFLPPTIEDCIDNKTNRKCNIQQITDRFTSYAKDKIALKERLRKIKVEKEAQECTLIPKVFIKRLMKFQKLLRRGI